MKYIGATVGFGIEVQCENKDEAAKLILDEAMRLLPDKEPFIIDMDDDFEDYDDED